MHANGGDSQTKALILKMPNCDIWKSVRVKHGGRQSLLDTQISLYKILFLLDTICANKQYKLK